MNKPFKILILGGTRNARDLAMMLAGNKEIGDKLHLTTSLAGRTQEPDRTFGNSRIGGFGGIDGLAKYLRQEKIDLLVDSTHPFATQISQNALKAAQIENVKRLVLDRPKWVKKPADIWIDCETLEEAADNLVTRATVFLALGHQYLDKFSHRHDVNFVARMIDKPKIDIPLKHHKLVIAKPSHLVHEEQALFEKYAITHLVCRNSGGTLIYAKIEAARLLQLPILMVRRPVPAKGNSFTTITELANEIIKHFA